MIECFFETGAFPIMTDHFGFSALHYAVLVAYIGTMITIGLLSARRQKSTNDFFLAGRSMPWVAVAMSIFASITSAITFMGIPGLVYKENISFFVGILMMPVVAPFIIYLFLPFYRRLNVTTSYEYIYRRFGPHARYCVSGLFICARLGWLGTVVYAPALAISAVTTIPLWLAIIMMGAISTAYTVLGGLTAVIWTDVVQFLVLTGGALTVAISLAVNVPGGTIEILRIAGEGGRLNLLEWMPRLTQMTVGAVALSYFFNFMHDYGVDQVAVQRLLATKDFRGMVRATVLNSIFTVLIVGMLAFIGLGLYAYHITWPDRLAAEMRSDGVFPYYIVHALPHTLSGVVIAALFSAAMSGIDSGINSIATVMINDFVQPLRRQPGSEASDMRLARALTVLFGLFATGVAFFASQIGPILKASQTFLGLFSGPVLALFLLGILTRRATFYGWLAGVSVAIPTTIWTQYNTGVHFIYYFPLSFALSAAVGYGASCLTQAPPVDENLLLRGSGGGPPG